MSSAAYNAGLDAYTASFLKSELSFLGKNVRAAGGQRAPEGKDWWLKSGPAFVHAYYTWRMSNPNLILWHTNEGVPAIELDCYIDLGDDTILNAKIDRVFMDKNTKDLIIVDLKTGKKNPNAMQLGVYRLALQQQFGISPKYGAYWMARGGNLAEIHDLDHLNPAIVSRWLKDVRKAISLEILPANLGDNCVRMCSVNQHCYAYNPRVAAPDFLLDGNLTVIGKESA